MFFCGSNASDRKRGQIDEKIMSRLINEAYMNGSRKISFHGMGNPCYAGKWSTEYLQHPK